MPSRNIAAYAAEEEILLRALESPRGLILRPKQGEQATKNWATYNRHRLNQCREADRQRSQGVWPEGDPRHGKSAFEGLVMTTGEDDRGWFVKIMTKQATLDDFIIEEVEDEDEG